MGREPLSPHNAIWDDGEWISWHSINSHLERLELQARYPKANVDLIPVFEELLSVAVHYYCTTGRHLSVYGDIGELFGAIQFGIELHRNYAKGSDGRLGDDYVEIKTITPFKSNQFATVRLDRHFSKLLVVKVDDCHEVSGRLVDRRRLPKAKQKFLRIHWDDLAELE